MRKSSCIGRDANVSGHWVVLGKSGALAKAVVERLEKFGADTVFIEITDNFKADELGGFQARLSEPEEIRTILRRVRSKPIQGAIYLGNLSAEGVDFVTSYHALVALVEGLENPPNEQPVRVIVPIAGAESVLGEPVRNPAGAFILGPVLVLPTEVAHLQMRAVDLNLPDEMSVESAADAIATEACIQDQERVVAWRRGFRWARRYERVSLPDPNKLSLKQNGVYLITGGLGGIGLTLARSFAAKTSVRLVLTARTTVPQRQDWDSWLAGHSPDDRISGIIRTVREIEELGSEVIIAAADAADATAMKAVIDQSQKHWGRIDGVIHAAGVAGSAVLLS